MGTSFAPASAWAETARLPALGANAYRLRADQIKHEVKGRPLGKVKEGERTPEEKITDRLEKLRQALKGKFDYFEGLVFPTINR